MELLNELSQFYQRVDIDLVNITKAEPVLKVEIAKKGKLYMAVKKNLKSSVSMRLQFMLILGFYIMIEEKL
jgi:hypothetical protein